MTADSLWFVLVTTTVLTDAVNILAIFPMASVSHNMLYEELMLELHSRGYNVTVMTTNPLRENKPVENYTEIDLSFLHDKSKNKEFAAADTRWRMEIMYLFFIGLEKHAERIFSYDPVRRIINGNDRFDLVILEWSVQPSICAFAERFNCPLIGIRPMALKLEGYDTLANPFIPSYMPLNDMDFETDFAGRLINIIHVIARRVMYHFMVVPQAEKLVKRFFSQHHHHHISDVEKNVSLVLSNTFPVVNGAFPLLPTIVEVGGLYLQRNTTTQLPSDIQKFLDGSPEGVILFSLGSVVQSWDLSDDKIEAFLSSFERLPCKILWRFDEAFKSVKKPKNVMFYRWVSQRAVLSHPNVRLFVTHAGLRSTEESLFAHVPMVCIPFFVDQYWNCRQVDKLGAGKRLYLNDITRESFYYTVKEVFENPKFAEKAAEVGRVMMDQPIPPMDKAVWWIEYVLRHNGAHHLKSEALWMSSVVYYSIDVLTFIIVVLSIILYVLFVLVRYVNKMYLSFRKKYIKID